MTDYRLLAEIMEEAAGYYRWRAGRLRLLHVVLNLSYRASPPQPLATLSSHAPLMQLTRFKHPCNLSAAISDHVSCRVLRRDGHGRGGLTLTPMPDWWNWSVQPVDEECADRGFVASLVGYIVRPAAVAGEWDIEKLTAIDPKVDFAQRYTIGQLRNLASIPEDPTLPEAVAQIAREEAARSVEPPPEPTRIRRSRALDEAPIDATTSECLDFARRLFPDGTGCGEWEDARRDAWVKKVCENEGPRVVWIALSLAKEFGPSKIREPWNWLARIIAQLRPK
jgi:hypothetical protein